MTDNPALDDGVWQAARLIAASRHCIALVGAGLSAESGVPTYRGQDGLWTRVGEPNPLSFELFRRDPAAWWRARLSEEKGAEGPRAEFRRALEAARPNPGHLALVDLEHMGLLKCIITQNVDNLHRVAGSRALVEVHGNRTLLRCTACGARYSRAEVEIDVEHLPPRCQACDGIVKGDGVMFGEPIPTDSLQRCFEEVSQTDCVLILGTSGVVYPAASFPDRAHAHGAALIEVNTAETPFTAWCNVALRGPSGEVLPRIVEAIVKERRGG